MSKISEHNFGDISVIFGAYPIFERSIDLDCGMVNSATLTGLAEAAKHQLQPTPFDAHTPKQRECYKTQRSIQTLVFEDG